MAKVMIVPVADYKVLKKYLGADPCGRLIIVPEDALNSFPPKARAECRKQASKDDIPYDFGGEPDVCIDLVLCEDSYAYGVIVEKKEEDEFE